MGVACVTVCMLLTFTGCAKDNIFPDQQEGITELSGDLKILHDLGFSIEGVIEGDDCYVVEGDIRIEKSALDDDNGREQCERVVFDKNNLYINLYWKNSDGNTFVITEFRPN